MFTKLVEPERPVGSGSRCLVGLLRFGHESDLTSQCSTVESSGFAWMDEHVICLSYCGNVSEDSFWSLRVGYHHTLYKSDEARPRCAPLEREKQEMAFAFVALYLRERTPSKHAG